MPLLLALRYWESASAAVAKGGGPRAKTFYWIPADTGKRWVLRTMEPDEMVAIAAVLGLSLREFVTLYAAAEEGALAA